MVSLAYLIIFLKIEPHAFSHFRAMFYLDVIFSEPKKQVDSVDQQFHDSIIRDTQITNRNATSNSSIDSDYSLTSISINSRQSSVADDNARTSSFITNPSLYVFDFIRDSLTIKPNVLDDRTEVELSNILENAQPLSDIFTTNSAVIIDTTINSSIHDVCVL